MARVAGAWRMPFTRGSFDVVHTACTPEVYIDFSSRRMLGSDQKVGRSRAHDLNAAQSPVPFCVAINFLKRSNDPHGIVVAGYVMGMDEREDLILWFY